MLFLCLAFFSLSRTTDGFASDAVPDDDNTPPRAEFTVDGPEASTFENTEVDFLETSVPHVSLSWGVPEDEERPSGAFSYVLQQADSPGFGDPTTLYEGRDRASFRGGLAEGDYFYRVRAVDENDEPGEWSRPLHVNVEYQSMTLAVALFAIGGIVVLATLVLVVSGAANDRREARQEEEGRS